MPRVFRDISLLSALGATLTACGGGAGGGGGSLATFRDSASYAIGLSMGRSIKEVRDSVTLDQVVRGLRDAAQGNERLAEEDVGAVLNQFTAHMRAMQAQKSVVEAKENAMKGEAFRKENAAKEGVRSTESGLQYEVLKEGDGPRPKATDQVTVNYRGTLIDGTEFDSSYDSGQPATFTLNEVIPGWTEGVQLMTAGSKYRFVIPPELAYGERGAGDAIGPNETLVFEVELLKVGR